MTEPISRRQKMLAWIQQKPWPTFLITMVLACTLGPISKDWGSISFSLQTFFVLLPLYLLPHRLTLIWILLYLGLGFAGLPVFSDYSGGWDKIHSPSVGFLAAFFIVLWVPFKPNGHVGVDAFYRHIAILLIGFGYLYFKFGFWDPLYVVSFLPWALVKSWGLYWVTSN